MTRRLKKFIGLFLPALMLMTIMAGTAPAALLDFGPITDEVVPSVPPNIQAGYPAWFRDTNRVPLQLCLEEVPGCLFAQADAPNPGQPVSFPGNIPDELFYYSATALIPNAIDDQLLFAGVEMNFAENADGTFDQVGFARVRIRISTTIAGDYTVTTPWKQYSFTVDQATIDDSGDGRRVINATEDIGLRPDGEFAGILLGNVGPYGYSQGAPFGTAPNLFLGDNTPRPLLGTPNNIFRIEGPNGFATVETNLFAVTGKLYPDPIPTSLTVDKLTYARDAAGVQVSAFATTQAMSNQVNSGLAFPANYALTNAPSTLQLAGAGLPTPLLTTNTPGDGKFFTNTGAFALDTIPANATITNTADTPVTVKTATLVDEIKITDATFNPLNSTLTVAAQSLDTLGSRTLSVYIPGNVTPLGTISNGQFSATTPFVAGATSYAIPPVAITVKSDIGGEATAPVVAFVSIPPAPAAPAALTGSGTPVAQTYTWAAVSNATSYTLFNNFDDSYTTFTAAAVGCASGTGTCTANQTKAIPAGTLVGNVVNAINNPVAGPFSAAISFTIVNVPTAPAALAGSGSPTAQTYTWSAVSNATSYTLYNNFDDSFTTFTADALGCSSGTGTCTANQTKAIPAGTLVGNVVNAINNSGTSPFSAASSFTIVNIVNVPLAPVALTGTGSPTTQAYTWNAVTNATNYTLFNNFDNSFTTLTAVAAGCGSGTGTCTVNQTKSIPAGTLVGNVVNATNSAGTSPYSDPISYVIQ